MVFLTTILAASSVLQGPLVRMGFNPAQVERNDPIWQKALHEVYRSPEELNAQDEREARHGFHFAKLVHGNPELREIALTFDDGPHPGRTEKLLALLRKEDVPATFFVVGKMVRKYPYLAREIVREGHLLGNHTFSHVTLTKLPKAYIEAEYQACNDLVYRTTGVRMNVCRPPGGDYDEDVIDAANDLGMTTVLWTDDPGDFAETDPQELTQRTMDKLTNGGIVLMHDGVPCTMQVLPKIIHEARARGFRFVTVRQLAIDAGGAR